MSETNWNSKNPDHIVYPFRFFWGNLLIAWNEPFQVVAATEMFPEKTFVYEYGNMDE